MKKIKFVRIGRVEVMSLLEKRRLILAVWVWAERNVRMKVLEFDRR